MLTESAAIVEYLAETFGDSAKLYLPHGVEARAALNESCYFIMTELDSGSLYVVRRHEELASIYGEAPAAVHSAKVYFLHNLEAIMPRIPEAGYLFSDLLSTADIC